MNLVWPCYQYLPHRLSHTMRWNICRTMPAQNLLPRNKISFSSAVRCTACIRQSVSSNWVMHKSVNILWFLREERKDRFLVLPTQCWSLLLGVIQLIDHSELSRTFWLSVFVAFYWRDEIKFHLLLVVQSVGVWLRMGNGKMRKALEAVAEQKRSVTSVRWTLPKLWGSEAWWWVWHTSLVRRDVRLPVVLTGMLITRRWLVWTFRLGGRVPPTGSWCGFDIGSHQKWIFGWWSERPGVFCEWFAAWNECKSSNLVWNFHPKWPAGKAVVEWTAFNK